MKVLKAGRDQSSWAKEFHCTGHGNKDGGCGALLLVERADLFLTFSSARDETETYVTFQCSQCHVLTDIPSNQYPSDTHLLPNVLEWNKAKI